LELLLPHLQDLLPHQVQQVLEQLRAKKVKKSVAQT